MTNQETYLITPSLLNSWAYQWNCVDYVRDTDNSDVCIEDKQEDAINKAKEDFIRVLKREPQEPNEAMKRGIEFEDACYRGETCISPIIKDGCYQIVGKKKVCVDGINFLMYGRLDVLKGGIIYDIKRVAKYNSQKYVKSYQHGFYMDLFQSAYKFTYLVYDGYNLFTEDYYRGQYMETTKVISQFINWLKDNNLFDLYKKYWKCV